MKKLTFLIIFLIGLNISAQTDKRVNFIISIDDDIPISSIHRTQMVLYKKDGIKEIILVEYFPGNLSLKEEDYKTILSDAVKSLYLTFDYVENCKGKQYRYDYEIELKKKWMEHYFFLLKIYNTNKRKYKKIFNPIEGKEFTYEYYYPSGQMLRVTKKERKNDCK